MHLYSQCKYSRFLISFLYRRGCETNALLISLLTFGSANIQLDLKWLIISCIVKFPFPKCFWYSPLQTFSNKNRSWKQQHMNIFKKRLLGQQKCQSYATEISNPWMCKSKVQLQYLLFQLFKIFSSSTPSPWYNWVSLFLKVCNFPWNEDVT